MLEIADLHASVDLSFLVDLEELDDYESNFDHAEVAKINTIGLQFLDEFDVFEVCGGFQCFEFYNCHDISEEHFNF